MLGQSTALISSNDSQWVRFIASTLEDVGFRDCRPYDGNPAGLTEYRRGPLPFVFLNNQDSFVENAGVIESVRTHSELMLRFSPIVAVAVDPSPPIIHEYVKLGCDDILLTPLEPASLQQRLVKHLNAAADYYQTDTYFGPDRRRSAGTDSKNHEMRGRVDRFFRHFVIQRHPKGAPKILSTETHVPGQRERRRA